jgi:hypothetical protein
MKILRRIFFVAVPLLSILLLLAIGTIWLHKLHSRLRVRLLRVASGR